MLPLVLFILLPQCIKIKNKFLLCKIWNWIAFVSNSTVTFTKSACRVSFSIENFWDVQVGYNHLISNKRNVRLPYSICSRQLNKMACLVFLVMVFSFIKLISSSDTSTKREAAILKVCPPAIITSPEVIIAEYDAILDQWKKMPLRGTNTPQSSKWHASKVRCENCAKRK